ncbi:MAG TPA: cytochrome c peroxidase [Puia sp.]|jgi:cytochrome c peroxidase
MTINKWCWTILLIVMAGYVFFSCTEGKPKAAVEHIIAQTLVAQVDSFSALCRGLQAGAESSSVNEKQLRESFLRARLAFKKIEWAAEYFEPTASRSVNGPPVQEVELSGVVIEPGGLQVIEGLLFPRYDTANKAELIRQIGLLQRGCAKYKTHFGNIDILDWQVFDAAKLEVFRIETLGITGFDNPLSLRSMEESAMSLESVKNALSYYGEPDGFDSAVHYLRRNVDFNTFDRATFITGYCDAITSGVTDLEARLKIKVTLYNRLLNQEAKTLFDTSAFNVNAYAPDPASFISPEKVALGKILFADVSLSGDGTRSCQSCHQPSKAFTDGLVKNTNIGTKDLLARNTPTLLNAALQPSQFYDLRAKTLEDQALTVVQNVVEMHGSMRLSVQRLWQDTTYRRLFAAAFPVAGRVGIDTLEVMNALGSYVRSLVFLNSRFDQYMRGNKAALTAEEVNGFNLFMGKAKCGTCHYMPLFNGNFPPRFVKTDAEVIGVPATAQALVRGGANGAANGGANGAAQVAANGAAQVAANGGANGAAQVAANGAAKGAVIDADPGRFAIVPAKSFLHAFKTPTVRNAARTGPYMHNGVFRTLEEVMDFYSKGGGAGLGIKIPNQTLPFDKLDLSENERNEIIAFIRSLDSQ